MVERLLETEREKSVNVLKGLIQKKIYILLLICGKSWQLVFTDPPEGICKESRQGQEVWEF